MQNERCESGSEQSGTAFIEVDEEDAVAGLQLCAIDNAGHNFVIGGIVAEPGRYELRKVEDERDNCTGGSERWECNGCGRIFHSRWGTCGFCGGQITEVGQDG